MSRFLAIYNVKEGVHKKSWEAGAENFTLNGNRQTESIVFDRCSFFYEKSDNAKIFISTDTFCFFSGVISFENSTLPCLQNSTIDSLIELLKNPTDHNLSKLEGAFRVIHYSNKSGKLTVFNDKYGALPVFFAKQNGCLIACSEYEPLISQSGEIKLNHSAIAEYFALGATLGNKTFVKGIEMLPPANIITANNGELQLKSYWSFNEFRTQSKPPSPLEFFTTFSKVNQEYIRSGIAPLCLLSAGADSRLILSTMTEDQRQKCSFYTSNLSILKEDEDQDVIVAKLLAKKLNLNHKVDKISAFEYPFDLSYFENDRKKRDKQAYGGWHGGEFLGGYCIKAAPIQTSLNAKAIHEKLKNIFSFWFRLKINNHSFIPYNEQHLLSQKSSIHFYLKQMLNSFFSHIYGGSRGFWLQPYQLSNHGLSPFWDSRIISSILSLPVEELKEYTFYNEVFQFCDPVFTEVPSNSPLVNIEGSRLPKLNLGIDPKHRVPNTHHASYLKIKADFKKRHLHFYNEKKITEILENEFDPITQRIIDFEMWFEHAQKQVQLLKHT